MDKRFSERLTVWVFIAGLLISVAPFASAQSQPSQLQSGGSPPASEYAGPAICKNCHEEIYKTGFDQTPHYKTTLQGGHGCESCHGPGAAHAADADVKKIIGFKNLSREEASARCLTCHGDQKGQAHYTATHCS